MKKFLLLIVSIFFVLKIAAQDKQLVDSLELKLKTFKEAKVEKNSSDYSQADTTIVNILYALSKAYWGNNSEKAEDYANQSLLISEKLNYKKGIGNSYNSFGVINDYKGNYTLSLTYYKKALAVFEEIGAKKGIATCYNNSGLIYTSQGIYSEALKNFFAALKLYEEIKDKKGISSAYNNIGNIYLYQRNFSAALQNYKSALKICDEIGNKYCVAMGHNNIGIVFKNQRKYPEALFNFEKALKTSEEIEDKAGKARALGNIGIVSQIQENYGKALEYGFAALEINKEIGDISGVAAASINIGNAYTGEKKIEKAAQFLNTALQIAKELKNLEQIKSCYSGLADLDSIQGNFKSAFQNYKNFIFYRDSINNEENTKSAVSLQMKYDFEKKEALTKVENEKKVQKQRLLKNGFIAGTILLLLLAGAILIGLLKTGKAKKKSEELLLNILPAEVADEIKITGSAKAKAFESVTVMFTDFKDFTTICEKVNAELLVEEIHICFSAFDTILQKHKIEKIKTIGDAYLCVSGLPNTNNTHAVDMMNAAFEIREYITQRKTEKEKNGEFAFELRIGIHTGPVIAGIVGLKKYAYDIWGDTVNLAARMEQNSEAGKINISGSTFELVKEKFNCLYRGKIQVKNKGETDMYFVES